MGFLIMNYGTVNIFEIFPWKLEILRNKTKLMAITVNDISKQYGSHIRIDASATSSAVQFWPALAC